MKEVGILPNSQVEISLIPKWEKDTTRELLVSIPVYFLKFTEVLLLSSKTFWIVSLMNCSHHYDMTLSSLVILFSLKYTAFYITIATPMITSSFLFGCLAYFHLIYYWYDWFYILLPVCLFFLAPFCLSFPFISTPASFWITWDLYDYTLFTLLAYQPSFFLFVCAIA